MKRKLILIITTAIIILVGVSIYFFSNSQNISLYRIQKNDKYGYIDSLGTELIKPQYLYATNFRHGLALVVVDTTIIRFNMDYSNCKNKLDSTMRDFIIGEHNDTIVYKYGYINCHNKIVIDTTLLLYENYNNKINAFIKDGNLNLSNYLFNNNLAVFQDSITKRYGYINKNGKIVIPADYLNASNFSEDLAAVNFAKTSKVKEKDTWGYINSNGVVVIKPRFSYAEDFSEGYAVTNLFKSQRVKDGVLDTEFNSNWIIINKSGNMIGEPLNGFFTRPIGFDNGICPVEQKFFSKSFGWKFMDENGKYTSDFNLTDITRYHYGYAGVKTPKGWVFVDKRLNLKSKFYECLNAFFGDLAPVKENGKWGYIDTTFQTVIPNRYDTCGFFRGALATFRIKSQSLIIDGYINKKGVIVWQNETYKFDGR